MSYSHFIVIAISHFQSMMPVFHPLKQLLFVLLLAGGIENQVFADPLDEAAVKAAFIYNFIKFIEWPDISRSQNAFTVCTTDLDALQGNLSVLDGKMLRDRKIEVRYGVVGDALKNCQLVFVSSSVSVGQIVSKLKNQPIVTVSDIPGFVEQGGGLGLIRDDNRISFQVNLDATNAAGVHVSAQLLKLAQSIKSSR